jgi:hypothetical protein
MKNLIKSALFEAAQNSKTLTYSQLAKKVGVKRIPDVGYPKSFYEILEQIGNEEMVAGRPLINSLVVRLDNNMPGKGFFTWLKLNAKSPDYRKSKRELINQVHENCFQYWKRMQLK